MGNEAVAMGAIKANCRFYFGYPITPQNEIPEYMSKHLPKLGGDFIQAESEIAAINMLLGASASGYRAMTSSSSPGISLKQEGISYLAGSELPGVIVNMTRSGPGLGGISASQGDYFQATKGGGHGDYRLIVLAPYSVQELYDLTIKAFELADKYRNPVMILGDAMIGQMQEPLEERKGQVKAVKKEWALTGAIGRESRFIKSLYLQDGALEEHNWKLHEKYKEIQKKEIIAEESMISDAEMIVVANGSAARISMTSVQMARDEGLKVGMIRPVSLFPFPKEPLREVSRRVKKFLTIELNTGQMVEDVQLSVEGDAVVHFYGRPSGMVPSPEEILEQIRKYYEILI